MECIMKTFGEADRQTLPETNTSWANSIIYVDILQKPTNMFLRL